MTSIKQIQDAFKLLHEHARDPGFAKTMGFDWWCEKDILPNIRFFLLGYFEAVEPEVITELIGNTWGEGRIDFVINNVAIEFAVRNPNNSKSKLTSYSNRDEQKKLIRRLQYNDHLREGVLVLFDFSNDPLTNLQLEEYREMPSLGKGNFTNKSGFSILYFWIDEDNNTQCTRKNVTFGK